MLIFIQLIEVARMTYFAREFFLLNFPYQKNEFLMLIKPNVKAPNTRVIKNKTFSKILYSCTFQRFFSNLLLFHKIRYSYESKFLTEVSSFT